MKFKVNIYVCEITKVYLLVDNHNGVCHVCKLGLVMCMRMLASLTYFKKARMILILWNIISNLRLSCVTNSIT